MFFMQDHHGFSPSHHAPGHCYRSWDGRDDCQYRDHHDGRGPKFHHDKVEVGHVSGRATADWWEWVLSYPEAENPQLDTTGELADLGDFGRTFFVAGTFSGDVERSFSVDYGQTLVIPLINVVSFATEPDDTAASLREDAAEFIDAVEDLTLIIDGKVYSDEKLFDFRTKSTVFDAIVPEGGVLPAGTYDPVVSDGYWVKVKGLSPGEHTIEFGGSLTDDEGNTFEVNITDNITVVADRHWSDWS